MLRPLKDNKRRFEKCLSFKGHIRNKGRCISTGFSRHWMLCSFLKRNPGPRSLLDSFETSFPFLSLLGERMIILPEIFFRCFKPKLSLEDL
jgi:hypothetical protein